MCVPCGEMHRNIHYNHDYMVTSHAPNGYIVAKLYTHIVWVTAVAPFTNMD